ncbi:MAG: hypothetical protein Q7R41_08285, partial [Phycisphaerales bacterium]|nr:hypothetical protein [Phycisphaerales bacterium]
RCSVDDLPGLLPTIPGWFPGEDNAFHGRPLIAFSERYVYIRVQYDGESWMDAIPRDPSSVTFIPWPGG